MPLAVAVTVRATAVISAQSFEGIPLSLTIKAPGDNIRRDVDADSRVISPGAGQDETSERLRRFPSQLFYLALPLTHRIFEVNEEEMLKVLNSYKDAYL